MNSSRTAKVLPLIHFAVDASIWAMVIPVANGVRRDFDFNGMFVGSWAWAIALAVLAQGIAGFTWGLYRRRWRYGSFEEVLSVAASVLTSGLVLIIVAAARGTAFLPASVAFISTAFVLTLGVASRSLWRLYRQASIRPRAGTPIVVIGAGNGAYQLTHHLLEDPNGSFLPVAFVDDDPLKTQFRIRSVRVEGKISELASVARRHNVQTALLAIPSASSRLVHEVKVLCDLAGLELLILPPTAELFGSPTVADIRPIAAADFLGRRQSDVDTAAIAQYVTGRRVLVTGAGGSIGSELCRQLTQLSPSELMMLDRDESGLHAVQLLIEGRAMLDSPDLILADLRDAERIEQIIAQRRPEVIFHAAALKHLTLLELNPSEAWKTNVVGTKNLLDAAVRHGVHRVVNISTDKAADPTCVLGFSKRITERLTADAAEMAAETAGHNSRYLSVRFGNVLGSRGSVLTAFEAQANSGGPITLTHPEVSRFFMTIAEAVALTISAGAIGESGKVLVLDMGEPVLIAEVAERYARRVTPPLPIVHTGLRPGEKLHEVLFGTDETERQLVHPLIRQVDVAPLSYELCLAELNGSSTELDNLSRAMAAMCAIPASTPEIASAS